MRLSRSLAVVGTAAALAAAYTGYWFYLADRVEDGIETWIASARRDGLQVQLGGLTVGGFPFAIAATAVDVRATRTDGLIWESKRMVGSARPWWWRRIDLSLPNGQRIELADVPGLTAVAEAGDGVLRLDGNGRITDAELTFDTVALALPDVVELVTIDRVTGSWSKAVPTGGGAPVIMAELTADSVVLPEVPLPDLGRTIDSVSLDLTLTGPLPSQLTEADLAAWRDASGLVSVDQVALGWGPLAIEGAGTASLDPTLQPQGTLTVDVVGFVALIDALVAAGHLDARPATFAKTGLNLLARPASEDGQPVLTAPLTLKQHRLSLGPVTLAVIPPVDWPAE